MLSARARHRDIEVPVSPALGYGAGPILARISGNPEGPVVVALGGISADRFVCDGRDGGPGWWPGFVGPGCAVDPRRHCILGLDFLADPAGRHAPSTQDQARMVAAALDAAGLARADAIVGASYGGMVALAFAQLHPSRVVRIVVISAAASPHPAATAARELQRRVVELALRHGDPEGLSIARGMAMLTYRTPEEFETRFRGGLDVDDSLGTSDAGNYLRARGKAFARIMSPQRFLSLSASIDRHRVDPALIDTPALLVGAETDSLVPPGDMRALAGALAGQAELHLRHCRYGHDMFLKESRAIGEIARSFLEYGR